MFGNAFVSAGMKGSLDIYIYVLYIGRAVYIGRAISMLYHRANHVSPTIVGNCLSCEDGQDVHAYLVDV